MTWLTLIWNAVWPHRGVIVAALIGATLASPVAYRIGQASGVKELTACQAERTNLLRAAITAQSLRDSVRWSRRLQQKEEQLYTLDKTILRYEQQRVSDSIQRVAIVDRMRAINELIRPRPPDKKR